MREILPFVPDQAFVLVIAALGLGLMTGLVSRRTVGTGIGLVIATLLVRPFIRAVLSSLPLWLLVPVILLLGLSMLRRLTGFILGRGAADEMIGALAADVVRATLRLMRLPFVLAWRLARGNW